MNQREVTDEDNIRWTCVQAYAGVGSITPDKAKQLSEADGKVPVVCTPSGGAKSVRLHLSTNWLEQLPDEVLIEAISSSAD